MPKRTEPTPKMEMPRSYRGKTFPQERGDAIIKEAKEHLIFNEQEKSIGYHWTVLNEKVQKTINGMKTVADVITYAQTLRLSGFDHRALASTWRDMITRYDGIMKSEFPELSARLGDLGDSPYSRQETLLKYRGRLVSNMYYWHMMYLLQCLAYIKEPKVVGEIGGGYGGLARLWLKNPIYRPVCYIDIDFPESLFFAEVFLRINFSNLKILYVIGPEKLDRNVISKYQVIFCPLNYVEAVTDIAMDLVINTGSMQEMTDDWVDFWIQWLKEHDCRWFYSANYFASPLFQMQETRSTWSPRLTPDWRIKLQRFNPAFMKIHGIFNRNLAEILAEKPSTSIKTDRQAALAQYSMTQEKILDGHVLLEALDIIHSCPDEEMIWDLLQRCAGEMPVIPKEALYLAQYLKKNAGAAFKKRYGAALENLLDKLYLVRAGKSEKI